MMMMLDILMIVIISNNLSLFSVNRFFTDTSRIEVTKLDMILVIQVSLLISFHLFIHIFITEYRLLFIIQENSTIPANSIPSFTIIIIVYDL